MRPISPVTLVQHPGRFSALHCFRIELIPPYCGERRKHPFPDNPLDVKVAALHGCWMVDDGCVFGIDHREESMLLLSDKYNMYCKRNHGRKFSSFCDVNLPW